MEPGASRTPSAGAEGRLRALAGLTGAIDIGWTDDRLLRTVVDLFLAEWGDSCTVRLTGVDGSDGTGVSSHPDAVRAMLDRAALDPTVVPRATEIVVSGDDPFGDWLPEHGLRQYAVVPIAGSDRSVGALVVTRTTDRPDFSGEDLAFAAVVASIVGVVTIGRRVLAHTTTVVDGLQAQAEVVEQISDALITCDEHLRILSWNTAAEKIYGYAASEAIGCDLSALLTSQYFTTDGVPLTLDDVLTTISETGRWDGELHERHAAGTPLVILASVSAADGRSGHHGGLVLVNRDITAQRHEEHLATHDALTGLPNRRMLTNRLHEAFARACRTEGTMAVLFIDLDGFKPINDRYGHAVGDDVLIITAQRLVKAVRRTDSIGRLGGDEFVVILEDAGTDENIGMVADRIVESVSAPMEIGDHSVSVRPSVGVAVARRPDAETHRPDQLLAAADRAMYVAKEHGRPVFAG
ncbi:hypothetical protein GCM10009557_03910 [Virgisporangium ochraceum]|uniref:Diguanylate cyclase with PAS/PAC and GAF sensors n=1 Tax=Virgisporangium ochraceum TaxID=65505 RepID=A0A8J4A2P0_9ACTN|nr:diguanylate cyclase [Virgisporangium ochraceum]GIJ71676.1 hypothetical protein Voc01_065930 [Virgisporangium ochraceum]